MTGVLYRTIIYKLYFLGERAAFMRESDPRVTRTRDHLKQCFFELLKKKTAEEISVRELCDLAHCSRNTFYMHFQYKDNLYNQVIDECIDEVLRGFEPLTSTIAEQTDEIIDQYICNVMDQMSVNADKLRIIISSDRNGSFQSRAMKRFVEGMIVYSEQSSGLSADFAEWTLICHYNAGALMGFMMYWLRTPEISLDRAKIILRDLMDSALHIGEKHLQGR